MREYPDDRNTRPLRHPSRCWHNAAANTVVAGPVAADRVPLAPRIEEVLHWLMNGASEKQVARTLGISRHTVHVYVKALYRSYGASSRGELLCAVFRERLADRGKE